MKKRKYKEIVWSKRKIKRKERENMKIVLVE